MDYYEKKYKKALERASKLRFQNPFDTVSQMVEYIFPELKESENEKIRKAIHIYLDWLDGHKDYQPKGDYTIKDMIAWLEKQGKQKTTDKVEPKFKVGDWIVCGKLVTQITSIENDGYTNSDQGFISFETAKKFHLWTIQDAKDGDVLTSIGFHNNCTFIFNGLDNWKFDEPNGDRAVATGYCCLSASADNMEFGIQGPDCVEVNTIKPATKIQRDLLFQKMKEAGYEWDSEKKELKKK